MISGAYLNVPCRFNSRFSGRIWCIKKDLLFRIGSGILLASGFCYIYIRSPSSIVQCDHSHLHINQVNHIPPEGKITLDEAITFAKDLIERKKTEWGCPGIAIAVSIDGKNTWSEGFGYADLENRVPCTRDTVMRIASISKPITMAAIAKMWENGKIDLDKPVQYYLPSFPEKEVDGEKVTITLHNLLSHMSGIRHYSKAYLNKKNDKNNNNENKKVVESSDNNNNNNHENSEENENDNDKNSNKKEKDEKIDEFYLKRSFKNVEEALTLFRDDPLVHKPGTKFLYTTHGWTLASAVLEKASNIPFPKLMTAVFRELGLHSTCFDRNEPIVYNRARFYRTTKNGQVVNVPYVDNSYKWAGGGFLSTVGDLIKFGNAMLYSFQYMGLDEDFTNNGSFENHPDTKLRANTFATDTPAGKPGYLKRSTMINLWKPVEGAKTSEASDMHYGLGWSVLPDKYEHPFCLKNRFYTCHTGNSVGTSSILLILPADSTNPTKNPPKGVVIAGLANLSGLSFIQFALSLAQVFERVQM